jgi:hypothetical protein
VRSCCDVDWWACNGDGSRCRRALLVPLIPAAPHGSCKWPRCRSSSFLLPHLLVAARSDEQGPELSRGSWQPCAGLATDEFQLGGPIILVAIRRQGISGFTSCAQGLTRRSRPHACCARILCPDSSLQSGIIARSVQEQDQERVGRLWSRTLHVVHVACVSLHILRSPVGQRADGAVLVGSRESCGESDGGREMEML